MRGSKLSRPGPGPGPFDHPVPLGPQANTKTLLPMVEGPALQSLDVVQAPMEESQGGRIVALVASDRAVAEGWASGAAHRLAARWAGEGHRVILADAGLESPSLHEVVDLPNREGLVDAVLYGASANRISRPMDEGYFLITAGTPVAEPAAVLRGSRWGRLTSGMSEAGVSLLLYLRAADASTPGFLGSASDIVVLSGGEELPAVVRDLEPLVRAVAGVDASASVTDGAGPTRAEEARPADEDVEGPARVTTPAREGGNSRIVLFVVLAIVLAAVLGWVLSMGLG